MNFRNYTWEVFICHATEDKIAIVEPLAKLLKKQLGENKVWYDKDAILDGDSLNRKIIEGASNSKIFVLVLSPALLKPEKKWPWIEIGKFLDNKNDDCLIPFHYNITEEEIKKETGIPSFLHTGKWQIVNENNLAERTEGILEKINYIKRKESDESEKRKEKGILISIIAIALLAISYLLIPHPLFKEPPPQPPNAGIAPFDTSKGSYNVLLLPFHSSKKCSSSEIDIEYSIITQLQDMNEKDNLNLQIKLDTIDSIGNDAEADSLGKKLNAHIVIWGDKFEHCTSDTTEACLRFANISLKYPVPGMSEKGKSEIIRMASLLDMRTGKLLEKVNYIIYWVAASRMYFANDFINALKYFKSIEKIDSINNNPALLFDISSCYFQLQFFDTAKFYLVKLLGIDSNSLNGNINYGMLLYKKFNDPSGAKKHFKKALAVDSNNALAHFDYALLLEDKFKDTIAAKKHYEISLSIDSNNANAHCNYALLLVLYFNDIIGAKKHYEKALAIDSNHAFAHCNYASLLENDFSEIIDANFHYEKALAIDSNNALFHKMYAKFLDGKLYDLINAKKHYEKSLIINPNDGYVYSYYGVILRRLHDFDNAKKSFEKALELIHNNEEIYCYYGVLLTELNDKNGAKIQFEKSLNINPNYAQTYSFYSNLLYEKFGDKINAKKYYLKAIRLNSNLKNITADRQFGIK